MTFPPLFQSYWRDEAFSVLLAQHSFPDIVRLVAHDFSPPLYFLLLKIWVVIFGTSEVATRSLSFVFYVFTLVTIGLFLRRYFTISTLCIFLSLTIAGLIHPLMTSLAFETRMYTLSAWLAVLSWYLFLQKRWVWYSIVTIIGLYTHYFMLLIFGVQGLWLISSIFFPSIKTIRASGWNDKIARLLKQNASAIGSFLLSFLIFLPWLIFFIHSHSADTLQSFWIPKPTFSQLVTLPSLLVFGHDTFSSFAYDVGPFAYLVYGLVILSLMQGGKKQRSLMIVLALWALVPGTVVWIFSQFATPLYLPRYLIISAPAMIILIIVSVHALRPLTKVILSVIVVILLMNYLMAASRFPETRQLFISTKENLREHIFRIKSYAKPSDYLLVESELDYHVAQVYWFDPEQVKIIGKTYEEIPDYVGKILIPRRAVLTKPYPKIEGYVLRKDRKVTVFNDK